ncbi:hypothetical protein ABZ896_41390 [Streptomyces sp. NPDC047072]|uniref:hypothetical protein n=1 Tax=Streptomyces sp. NPDC047072 TaxID=3154809 RepID=UPI0033FB1D97
MSDGFNHNYDETDRVRDRAREQGTHLDEAAGSRLRSSRTRLQGTRGRGALSEAIGAAAEEAMRGLEQAQRQLRRHMDDMADGLDQMSRNHRTNDDRVADQLRGIGDRSAGQTPTRPLALEAGPAGGPTHRDVLNWRNRRASGPGGREGTRWFQGEQFTARMWGGRNQDNHVPVPTNDNAPYPVTRPGGRNVDVTSDGGDGRTYHVETKTYQRWKTVEGQAAEQFVPLSDDLFEQIAKDVNIRRADPNVELRWDFADAHPSPELANALRHARIVFVTRN